jgi:hypothetical protein
MVVTNEARNELSIQASASGLPNVNAIVHAALAANQPRRGERVRSPSEPPRPNEERRAPPQRISRPAPAPQQE